MRLLRPRIFISYAREDSSLAKSVRDLLVARGFDVFVDTEGTLAGEDFVRRLDEELRAPDAVIALLTPSSAASEWCQAEWYFAHARGITVIPVRVGDVEPLLPAPVRLLGQRIHFLDAVELEQQKIGLTLAEQLGSVRAARRRAALSKAEAILAAAAAFLAFALWLVGRAEWLVRRQERNRLVQRITTAAQPIAGADLAQNAARFANDDELTGTVLRIASDAEATDVARLNAVMLAGELSRHRKAEQRWALRNLKWRNGHLERGVLTNTTFISGTVENLAVRRSSLASVFWGRELTLSNASFRNVRFDGGGFSGTNAIRLDFLACLFQGVEIDLTNFALARFRSVPSDPEHPNVVNGGEVSALENCVIVNTAAPPAPRVMDLSNPADEVQFDGVVFTGVRFRGYIRPEWFRNCSFDRCTLAKSMTIAALERGENRVTDSIHTDEPAH